MLGSLSTSGDLTSQSALAEPSKNHLVQLLTRFQRPAEQTVVPSCTLT